MQYFVQHYFLLLNWLSMKHFFTKVLQMCFLCINQQKQQSNIKIMCVAKTLQKGNIKAWPQDN